MKFPVPSVKMNSTLKVTMSRCKQIEQSSLLIISAYLLLCATSCCGNGAEISSGRLPRQLYSYSTLTSLTTSTSTIICTISKTVCPALGKRKRDLLEPDILVQPSAVNQFETTAEVKLMTRENLDGSLLIEPAIANENNVLAGSFPIFWPPTWDIYNVNKRVLVWPTITTWITVWTVSWSTVTPACSSKTDQYECPIQS